ncbi:MAG: leucine-rich repeat protein [Clostridia bacterium]|nr:leucine-rich repeat protein [Clostridia bacterium]
MKKLRSLGIISTLCALLLCIGLFFGCNTDTDPLVYEDRGENYAVKATNTDITGDITIPAEYDGKPVILAEGAFKGCTKITSVTISEGIKAIPIYAFADCCPNVINIPVSVTSIGLYAFNESGYKINYSGTKEQFRKIGNQTSISTNPYNKITCTDGTFKN